MRCWDALLCEGPKILFRVALALMKAAEEQLLGQDNAGYVLRQMRLAAASTHDRDALMKARPNLALYSCAFALLSLTSAPAPQCSCARICASAACPGTLLAGGGPPAC
jgi:hypothetical protein